MKTTLKEYFSFSASERIGFLVLAFLILLVTSVPYILPFFPKEPDPDFSQFRKEVAEFEALLKDTLVQSADLSGNKKGNDSILTTANISVVHELFAFDPNVLPDDGWERLGLNEKQVHSIRNYESKGGKFESKEDVKKMYAISERLYDQLEPFISLPDKKLKKEKPELHSAQKPFQNKPYEKKKEFVQAMVELNSADSVTLVSMRGIGPWTASKIIRYRERLGGFVRKEQLLEIRGMDSAQYNLFSPYLIADAFEIKKINVNAASCETMTKHPYIDFTLCRVLVNYRLQHGNYKSISDIKKCSIIDPELFVRLSPYLDVK